MAVAKKSSPRARTVADFKAQHDRNVVIPNKIKAALEKMEKDNGPEHFEYESDFIKASGISTTDLGLFRGQFEKYIVDAKAIGHTGSRATRRVWFATVKAAKEARGE